MYDVFYSLCLLCFYGCWFNGWCFSFCYKMFTEQLKEESRHNIHRVLSGCHFIHYVRVSHCRRCSCFSLYNLHLTSSPFSGLLGRIFKHAVFTHWLYVSYSILNRVNITPSKKETKPADVWISLDKYGLICNISFGLVSRPHWRIHGIFLADTRIAAFYFIYLFVYLFDCMVFKAVLMSMQPALRWVETGQCQGGHTTISRLL